MLTLNLVDVDRSEIKYKIVRFSDSQVQFTLDIEYADLSDTDIIIVSRMSWDDVQIILAAHGALREAYADNIHLKVPYFIGGRSDRKFTKGGVNYIKDVIAPIINRLEFTSVNVMDPHSDVLEACLLNLEKVDNVSLVEWALEDIYGPRRLDSEDPFILISPDAGALKKVYHVAENIGYTNEIITASKHRDIATGKILSTEVPVDLGHSSKDFVIVDDICDGGRTFIEIAKNIKYHLPYFNRIYLIVTHGIFSGGFDELNRWFTKIYTTNSVRDFNDEKGGPGYLNPSSFIKQFNVF